MDPRDFPNQYQTRERPSLEAQTPVAQWYQQATLQNWTLFATVLPANVLPLRTGWWWTTTWETSTFDLRPDLRSSQAGPKTGTPIWSRSARLYIQVQTSAQGTGIVPVVDTDNMTIRAQEWTAPMFNYETTSSPGAGITAGFGLLPTSWTDVSAKFSPFTGAQSVLATFAPPGNALGQGEGYPVRYWRLRLFFFQLIPHGLPLLPVPVQPENQLITAAMY